LSSDAYDFGADDLAGSPIEERVPDYDILDQIEYQYPVYDAYFGYASRDCVRNIPCIWPSPIAGKACGDDYIGVHVQ
jgi:hypothetical protein